MNEIGFEIASIQIGWWKIAQVPDHVAATKWDMRAVCCMMLVDDNFHYPLIPSNPLCDLSELIFEVFKNPRENGPI